MAEGELIRHGGFRVGDAEIDAVAAVLRSGWPGPGPVAEQFEARFASSCGARHVVAVSSGTAALQIAVRLLDLSEDTEVITTPITFVSTNSLLLDEGLVSVFAVIEPLTGNVAVESIAARIGPRTGALVVVHYGGYPCDLDALYALARQHGLPIVEDCAHAVGSTYRGRAIGSHHTFQAFSFQATKNLPLVDGGMLVIDDEELTARARRLRWLGIDAATHVRLAEAGYRWDYEVTERGFRAQLSDLNAALGLAGLDTLPAANQRRREIAARYRGAIDSLDCVRALVHDDDRQSSYHLFGVLSDDRDRLRDHLRSCGIVCGVHYRSNDLYPIFERADVPAAHRFSECQLSLPMHLGLTDADVDRVIEALESFAR